MKKPPKSKQKHPSRSGGRAKQPRLIKNPYSVYQAIFNERWPEDWNIQSVMGLTDPQGKVIYISDGLGDEDGLETLLHEFLHMRGLLQHDQKFQKTEKALFAKARKLNIHWDSGNE